MTSKTEHGMLPDGMDWCALHVMVDNTRVAILRLPANRFGVVAVDSQNTVHQLPVFSDRNAAEAAHRTLIKAIWAEQERIAAA